MFSKKILIDSKEAYLQMNKNPIGKMGIYWISNSIYRKLEHNEFRYKEIDDNILHTSVFHQCEILSLNGFDYTVDDPNYSLIQSENMMPERPTSTVNEPDMLYGEQYRAAFIILNNIWRHHFKNLAQEDIVDFEGLHFRQPFYMDILVINETVPDAHDGVININNAWGGGTLEYSIINNVWQESSSFTNLDPDDYTVRVRDNLGNVSTDRLVTVEAGV